ncbi:MAG: hypothetical protein IJ795_03950, partial [Bacteroidales bacterium]|nr:hypothetical protein [Bacteroidales bacterium]
IFGLVKNLLYLQCLFPVTSGEIQVIGFRISYAKIAQSVDKVPFLLVEFIRVIDNPPDVEGKKRKNKWTNFSKKLKKIFRTTNAKIVKVSIKPIFQPDIDLSGAENETRARDPDLGKVVLYQLNILHIFIEQCRNFLF